MDRIETSDPFLILREIEARCRNNAKALPRTSEEMSESWKGIGFLFDGHYCVAPLEQVAEILPVPTVTRVPHVKFWLEGMANVRGNLLPIMELSGYLGLKMPKRTKDCRIIVANHAGISSGMIVEDVLGLQHFWQEYQSGQDDDVAEVIRPYLDGTFVQNGERWHVFNLYKLIAAERFLQAAV